MPKSKQYKQKFRSDWLKQEVFRNWLDEVKENNSVAHCKLCKCDINAKYSDLITHSKSNKHIKVTPIKSVPLTKYLHVAPNSNVSKLEGTLAKFELEELQSNGEEHEDTKQRGQDLEYSIAEETAFDNDFLLLDNGSLQPLKTPTEVTKKTPIKVPKRISIQNQKEPAPKKTKLYGMKSPLEMLQQLNAFQSTPDEFETFGNSVAAHLRSLSTIESLESQSDITQYLVQKRLGRRPMFVTNPDYVQDSPTNSI